MHVMLLEAKKMLNWLKFFIPVICLFFYSTNSLACKYMFSPVNINLQNLNIDISAGNYQPGDVVYTVDLSNSGSSSSGGITTYQFANLVQGNGSVVTPGNGPNDSCPNPASYNIEYANAATQSGIAGVYLSNVPQLGFRITGSAAFNASTGLGSQQVSSPNYQSQTFNYTAGSASGNFSYSAYGRRYPDVYDTSCNCNPYVAAFGLFTPKTAKLEIIYLGGQLPAQSTFNLPSVNFRLNGNTVMSLNYNGAGSATFNVTSRTPGCTPTGGTDFNVALDNINANALPSVGSTIGDKPLNIGLHCLKTTVVKLALSATAASGLANSGVVASSGTAQGLGVQVLQNGSAFPINGAAEQVLVQGSMDSDTDIPLSVRYYRTGTITSGNVYSLINYTITYE